MITVQNLLVEQPVTPQPYYDDFQGGYAYTDNNPVGEFDVPIGDAVSPQSRNRGLWLTLWLLLYTVGGVLAFFGLVSQTISLFTSQMSPVSSFFVILLLVIASMFLLVYAFILWHIWRWRRWALYVMMGLSFILLPIGPLLTLTWWWLTQDKERYFQ